MSAAGLSGDRPENDQYIWPTDSRVTKAVEALFIANGKALPSGSGPWSNAEVRMMLGTLDPAVMSELYSYVEEQINSLRGFPMGSAARTAVAVDLNITGFAHTNTGFENVFAAEHSDGGKITGFMYNELDRVHTVDLSMESWISGSFYFYFCYYMGQSPEQMRKASSVNFSTNLLYLTAEGFSPDTDMSFPDRGFLSAGGGSWNIMIGRDRFVLGNGESGNLILSDSIPYHNALRATAFAERLKYTFFLSFFPHPVNYGYNEKLPGSHTGSMSGLELYLCHRLETRLFNDMLSLSASEAIIYQSEEGTLQPEILNPLGFFHNYYISKNANSTASLEFSFTPVKGLSLYFQFLVDDLKTVAEGGDNPNQVGALAGVRYAGLLDGGILTASAEAALTSPYTYLRSVDISNDQTEGDYGVNYIVATHVYGNYYKYYLGYTYGNDCIVADFRAGWDNYRNLRICSEALFIFHGERNELYRLDHHKVWESNLCLSYDLRAAVTWNAMPRLELAAQADLVSMASRLDFQLVLSATYRIGNQ